MAVDAHGGGTPKKQLENLFVLKMLQSPPYFFFTPKYLVPQKT
jgi:hypothetical protein